MYTDRKLLYCKGMEAMWINNVKFFEILKTVFEKNKQKGYTTYLKFAYIGDKFITTYCSKKDIEEDTRIYNREGKKMIVKDIPDNDFDKVKRDLNELLSENGQLWHLYIHEITSDGVKIGLSGL